MISTWLGAPLTNAVDVALGAAPEGRIAVLGDAGLVRRLGIRGREAVLVQPTGGGGPGTLPFADGELAALVGPRLAVLDGWDVVLAEWRRTVKPGGLVVLLDRGDPAEPARRALCGGLTDVGQRVTGRTVVTSGRVVAL